MLFINNKYNVWYFKIIENAKSRQQISDYTEIHHIIPKSLGGSNDKDNLVRLTAREHFICHVLLTKMTNNKNKDSMVFALHSMGMKNNNTQQRYINSRFYEKNKLFLVELQKIKMKTNNPMFNENVKTKHQGSIDKRGPTKGSTGFKHSEDYKLKMSELQKGKIVSQETREKLRDYNLKLWEERRKSNQHKRKPLSEETKQKISQTLKLKHSKSQN